VRLLGVRRRLLAELVKLLLQLVHLSLMRYRGGRLRCGCRMHGSRVRLLLISFIVSSIERCRFALVAF